MTEEMETLRRDFLPEDLAPLLRSADFDATVAVQARQMLEETEWLLELSERHSFIAAVVGWVDLCSPEVTDQLESYSGREKLKGVRHVVHDEPDDHFMLREDFQRGMAALAPLGLTYDLLLFPKHLPVAARLVETFPDQAFVLDHIAKPDIETGATRPWREDLKALSSAGGVYCKLSGMVTEARWRLLREDDFRRYLDIVLEVFGAKRLMIGSDWPVCTLSGDYAPVMGIVTEYVAQLGRSEAEAILGGNAARFYGVDAS
jgi:L-fuconolactonase